MAAILWPAAGSVARGAAQAGTSVSLIYAGWFGNTIPTPGFIRNNMAFLETQPFRGLVAYLRDDATGVNATSGVMTRNAMSAATLTSILNPLQGLPFRNLVDNFGLVQGSSPPDFFDDWTNPIQNFANLASALKEAGLKGICFDNEQYSSPWGTYPAGARYPSRTLQEYRAQARLRGAQVMQAMTARFPGIAVITLHGPYISELTAPASLQFPQWQSGNMLLGPFFAGFLEGAGTSGVSVDGGELYTLRTDADFINSYNWRKFTLPSATVDCPFIPTALRTDWPDRVSISFGIYDRPFSGAPMDASTLRTTLTNSLKHADRYVWFYTEGPTFLRPASAGGASAAWVDAVRQAIATAPAPTPPPAPSNLTAVSLSASDISLSWASTGTSVTGFEIQRKVGAAEAFATLAQVPAGQVQYSDASLSSNTTYVYRIRSLAGTLTSTFSSESSATTAAPTSPPEVPTEPVPPAESGGTGGGGGGGGGSCGLLGVEALLFLLGSSAGRRLRRPLTREA
jgi:hypothetical protein